MNKTQLVDALTERLGDRRTATTAVEGLLETIVDTVRSGDSVSLTGFGVFEGRARAARTARNPRTGEAVDVPATTVPAFRPGAAFRSAVGGSGAAAPRSAPTRSSAAAVAAEPEAAAPAEKPTRRKATPKTTAKATAKPTEEAAPEATPKSRTRSAKVGSSFAASADQPAKSAKAEKSAKPEKAEKATKNGNGKAKPAGRSGEKSGKADDKAKKAKGKK